ncbi:hypothetical protein AC579_413 [Pseudocercospora musae]|uniref:Uncharacterized protein n=1 Tax=Pseudocercospora musae TaxID=113226 RepID=A0A139HBE9_9PEZI|nr:hypothetical protein AC579_413 [Pseudocercospora musae]
MLGCSRAHRRRFTIPMAHPNASSSSSADPNGQGNTAKGAPSAPVFGAYSQQQHAQHVASKIAAASAQPKKQGQRVDKLPSQLQGREPHAARVYARYLDCDTEHRWSLRIQCSRSVRWLLRSCTTQYRMHPDLNQFMSSL